MRDSGSNDFVARFQWCEPRVVSIQRRWGLLGYLPSRFNLLSDSQCGPCGPPMVHLECLVVHREFYQSLINIHWPMCNTVSTSCSWGVSIAKWSIGYQKTMVHGRKNVDNHWSSFLASRRDDLDVQWLLNLDEEWQLMDKSFEARLLHAQRLYSNPLTCRSRIFKPLTEVRLMKPARG